MSVLPQVSAVGRCLLMEVPLYYVVCSEFQEPEECEVPEKYTGR